MSAATHDALQSVVDGVDAVAVEMESKWGVGRLRLLVADDLRERFDRQARKFNEAIWGSDLESARQHGAAMARAWRALDAAATAAGAQPLQPEVWETATPAGEVIALVRTQPEAAAVARANRAMRVFTLEEVGRVIAAWPELLGKATKTCPGAEIVDVRVKASWDQWTGDSLEGAPL